MTSKKHILWDLDGTIVDSEQNIFKFRMFEFATKKLGLIFNLKPDEYIGFEARKVFQSILSQNDISNKEKFIDKYQLWYEDAVSYILNNINDVKPRRNVIQIWRELTKYNILHSVVTSSRRDVTNAYLKNIGILKDCKSIISIDDVKNPKPSPEPYLISMKELGIYPNDCIVIEDSLTGIEASKNAGIFTIAWVENKDNFLNSRADLIIENLSFKEILEVMS